MNFITFITASIFTTGYNARNSRGTSYMNNRNYYGSRGMFPDYPNNVWRGGRWW